MAVPQKRSSKRVRNQRRSHHALVKPNVQACSNCGALIAQHRVCGQCGHYKGKEVVQVEAF